MSANYLTGIKPEEEKVVDELVKVALCHQHCLIDGKDYKNCEFSNNGGCEFIHHMMDFLHK